MERLTGFMTPRNRQATVALADEGDDDRLVNERGAITEAVAPRGTAGGPPEHGEGKEDDLEGAGAALGREIREEEAPTSLSDEEAALIAFEMLPSDVQDASWQYITGKHTLEKLIDVVNLEQYEGLTMEEQEGLVHGVFRVEIHMAVLEILSDSFGAAAVDYQQTVAQEQLAALRSLVNKNPTWCWVTTETGRPPCRIRRWTKPMATKCLAEFRSTSKAAMESRQAARRGDDKPRSLYLRTGEQASAMAEFIRSSSRDRPSTATALELFGQIDSVILMTAEEGLTMRNLQHASRFNAWLSQQCSQWTNTMLPALRQNGCPEHECVHCFFTHVQKMFNMPNLYRLSLEQLKGVKQTELVAGASYVLQFMQARVVTMQLADRTGRSQWEFVSQQACGDQLMRQMLPEYLRQFLLVAAADEYFRECTRTGFPFIMEDVPGHKTLLTLSETTDSVFAALDASTVGKESLPATVFKKPPEFLQRPPVVRSFDFPARRGARPTMVHTAQVGGASSYERPVRETRPGTGPGASYERPVRENRPGTGPGGARCAHDVYPKFWPVKGTGSLPPMVGGVGSSIGLRV